MELKILELIKTAIEYLKMIGGICVLCDHAEVIYVSGGVKCKKLGDLALPVLKCAHYEAIQGEEQTKLGLTKVEVL
jgi:hypothetical protein